MKHEAHIDKSSKKNHVLYDDNALFLAVPVLITFRSADYYVAPEIYKNNIFDKRVDVHSFGVILYEVVTYNLSPCW